MHSITVCGGLHDICSTARFFDLRCESVAYVKYSLYDMLDTLAKPFEIWLCDLEVANNNPVGLLCSENFHVFTKEYYYRVL